jgi:hypothetical protein
MLRAPQASVPKPRIWFLLDQFKPVDPFFFNCLLNEGIKHEVCNVVGQRTPD